MRIRVLFALVCAILVAAAPVRSQQARDATARPSGTAMLSGSVTTAGDAPAPLRAAIVTLNHVEKTYGDTVIANDDGRFEFRNVPAGRYTVTARKSGYIVSSFGSTQSGRAGTPIAVSDGAQIRDLRLSLVRGGVLSGTVRHPAGEPVPEAGVELMRVTTVGGERRFEQVYAFGEGETDDRGMFRLFGIPPGEYVLRAHAEPWAMMHGAMSVHEMTAADIQWARSQMQGGASMSSVSAEPPPRRPRAYAPSYYPGTSSRAQAAVIRLAPGEERTGLDITTQAVATSRVRGTVEFAGARDGDVPNVNFVEVDNADSFFNLGWTHGWSFSLDGVPPGRYLVTATLEKSRHFGTAEVVVSGQDQSVQIRLREPLTLRGVLSFRESSQAVPKGLRVELAPLGTRGTLTISPEPAALGADGSFEVKGIMPGRYRVNPQIPGAGAWSVETIKAGDLDVTAVPLVLTADASTPPLIVTLTGQPTELSGRFEDASGRPATDYFIIVFSPDERAWYRNSRAIAQTRPGTDGRFSVRALPPGNYLLAAVTDVERDQWFSPDFLKELVPAAVKVTLGAGEKKVQDLRIAK